MSEKFPCLQWLVIVEDKDCQSDRNRVKTKIVIIFLLSKGIQEIITVKTGWLLRNKHEVNLQDRCRFYHFYINHYLVEKEKIIKSVR